MPRMWLIISKQFGQRVKGGALQYTIVFSLLILMSLSLFLMFVRLSSLEVYSSQKQSQLIENCNSAIVLLENQSKLFDRPQQRFRLLEDSTYLTDITISEWGFYDVARIVSRKGRQQLSKTFLFADDIKRDKRLPSLYFSGANQYLSIGGKAYLGYNTFLPAYGIRKSYVNGVGYNRDSLVHGNSFKAATTLPKLNQIWEDRYLHLRSQIEEPLNRKNIRELKQDSVSVSFADQTLILECPDNYILKDHYLNGNIIITGKAIRIENTNRIHRCIVVADSIVIDKKFQGEVQLLADDYLEIGESSVLKAPSILYLHNSKKTDQIVIRSQSAVQGEIVVSHPISDSKEILVIENECRLIGQIYCDGDISFEGVLFGSIYTSGFIKRSRNGLYENYLVDVCIDSKRLPNEYCGISLVNNPKAKVCADELN